MKIFDRKILSGIFADTSWSVRIAILLVILSIFVLAGLYLPTQVEQDDSEESTAETETEENTDGSGVSGVPEMDQAGLLALFQDFSGPESLEKVVERDKLYSSNPLHQSIQKSLDEELKFGVRNYLASRGGCILLEISSGRILAISSVTRNGAAPSGILSEPLEFGSVMKVITAAMALESGKITRETKFDARYRLVIGDARIQDFHAQRRIITISEGFLNSSNIVAARIASMVGMDYHRQFLKRIGLLEKLPVNWYESMPPSIPEKWSTLTSATVSFGHGILVEPLHALAVFVAVINDGIPVVPNFDAKPNAGVSAISTPVVSKQTSLQVRNLLRSNVLEGSARKLTSASVSVSGKTGTSQKIVNGRYAENKVVTSFVGYFPAEAPRYAILLILDEPGSLVETYGFRTAGWNAVPLAGKIIERSWALLKELH